MSWVRQYLVLGSGTDRTTEILTLDIFQRHQPDHVQGCARLFILRSSEVILGYQFGLMLRASRRHDPKKVIGIQGQLVH